MKAKDLMVALVLVSHGLVMVNFYFYNILYQR